MFGLVLSLHSLWRWLVLVAVASRAGRAILARLTDAPYGTLDRRMSLVTLIIVDIELTLGIVLYALSPTIRQALADPGAAMKNGALRLVFVEHPFTMLVAVVLIHVAHVFGKRATAERPNHTPVLVCVVVALVLMLSRIPW